MELVGRSGEGRRIATLPVNMDIDSRELGRLEGDRFGRHCLILVGQQMLPDPGKRCLTCTRWSVGMRVQEERTELEVDAWTIGDVLAQQLDTEVFGLEQEGIAASGTLRTDPGS